MIYLLVLIVSDENYLYSKIFKIANGQAIYRVEKDRLRSPKRQREEGQPPRPKGYVSVNYDKSYTIFINNSIFLLHEHILRLILRALTSWWFD